MKTSQPLHIVCVPLSHVAITAAGMILCLLACGLVLIQAGTDQTGNELLTLAESFDESLTGTSTVTDKISVRLFDHKTEHLRQNSHARTIAGDIKVRTISSDVDRLPQIDVHASRYQNLLNELRRFGDVSEATAFSGEVTVDLLSTTVCTEKQVADLVLQGLQQINRNVSEYHASNCYECEIILWSPSSRRSDLSSTAIQAARVRSLLCDAIVATPDTRLVLSSSARLWSHRQQVRPAATLSLRRMTSSADVGR